MGITASPARKQPLRDWLRRCTADGSAVHLRGPDSVRQVYSLPRGYGTLRYLTVPY